MKVITTDPELISINTPSEGEEYNAADHLLREMESGEKKDDQDELWAEVLKFGNSIYTNKEWFDTMKSRYTITRKQH